MSMGLLKRARIAATVLSVFLIYQGTDSAAQESMWQKPQMALQPPGPPETNGIHWIEVYMTSTGGIYHEGTSLDVDTLRLRLSTNADRNSALILYSPAETPDKMSPAEQQAFRSLMKLGLKTVWIPRPVDSEPGREPSLGSPPGIAIDTRAFREALGAWRNNQAESGRPNSKWTPDVTLRFSPAEEDTYQLHRLEIGVQGYAIWVVRDFRDESENAIGIQFKKSW